MTRKRDIAHLWSECEKAVDELKSVAERLGFAARTDMVENSLWRFCPHCRTDLILELCDHGMRVRSEMEKDHGVCRAIPTIEKWLCDEGYQS